MGLTNRTVWLIVIAMVLSLGGLVGLQASLMKDALESNEASFRQNVMAALNSVVLSLETDETTHTTLSVFGEADNVRVFAEVTDSAGCVPPEFELFYADTIPGRMATELLVSHDGTLTDSVLIDTVLLGSRRPNQWEISGRRVDVEEYRESQDTGVIIVQYRHDGPPKPPEGEFPDDRELRARLVADSARVEMITRVVNRLTGIEQKPLMERLDTLLLDSLLQSALASHGLEIEPVYGVIDRTADSLLFGPKADSTALLGSEYQAALFPRDILAAPTSLTVFFPERTAYLFKQIGPMLFAITLFMLVITLGFAYSIRTIIAQRRTAQLMVDFVNNMTHEFKTPISTVALACEAIVRPDVIDDPRKVERFSHMIRDENRRMRRQAEKILQMAALEEKDERLKLGPVDLHNVIGNAVDSIALQVEARGGKVTCDLAASSPLIQADELHLTGIIYNLLDNANKYSPDTPSISVRTYDEPQGIVVAIQDLGMGMKPEDQKRMFQKYFRVSQGDRHDIKGFGLGLSYVQLMMRAHKGRLSVDSEPGRGTNVKLWLPRPDSPAGGQA